jgi:hypothetical protein
MNLPQAGCCTTVIVIFRAILKLPGKPTIGRARDLGRESPTSEGPGAFTNVRLGIIAGAKAEQLEQLAAPVLVDRVSVVLLVVQPEDHRRILGNIEQQITVITHALVTEELDLRQQLIVIVHL